MAKRIRPKPAALKWLPDDFYFKLDFDELTEFFRLLKKGPNNVTASEWRRMMDLHCKMGTLRHIGTSADGQKAYEPTDEFLALREKIHGRLH